MRRGVGKVAILAFAFAAGFGLIAMATGSAATSAAWRGVVVAKDPARNAVVTASANGVARTLRAATARDLRVGQAVLVRARLLGDKTYRAQRITSAGRASKVQLRGVLVAHQRTLGRYLVSAGGSVLAVRARNARATAGVSHDRAGDRVVMTLSLVGGTPTATSVHTVGHTGTLELEGIFLGTTPDGKVRLAVANRGEVLVTVPAGQALPPLSPCSELQLEVTVDAAGGFTLAAQLGGTSTEPADDENDDDQGDDNDDQGATTTTPTTTTTTTTSTTTTTNDDQGDDNNDQGDDNDDQGDDSGGDG